MYLLVLIGMVPFFSAYSDDLVFYACKGGSLVLILMDSFVVLTQIDYLMVLTPIASFSAQTKRHFL